MAEENNLADVVEVEGENPFNETKDEEVKETSQDSPPKEETEEEKSPSSQGEEQSEEESKEESADDSKEDTEDNTEDETKLPFHKHPRWIEREKKWKNEIKTLKQENKETLKEALESIKPQEPKTIPRWFKGIYGDDQEMWNEYQSGRASERQSIKKEILDEQKATVEKQATEQKKADDWINDEIAKLKADGKKFNRNELLKVALDYRATDAQGNIDFEKSFEIMEVLKKKNPKKSKALKKLADSTVSGKDTETTPKSYKTPEDLKMGWDALTRE